MTTKWIWREAVTDTIRDAAAMLLYHGTTLNMLSQSLLFMHSLEQSLTACVLLLVWCRLWKQAHVKRKTTLVQKWLDYAVTNTVPSSCSLNAVSLNQHRHAYGPPRQVLILLRWLEETHRTTTTTTTHLWNYEKEKLQGIASSSSF